MLLPRVRDLQEITANSVDLQPQSGLNGWRMQKLQPKKNCVWGSMNLLATDRRKNEMDCVSHLPFKPYTNASSHGM